LLLSCPAVGFSGNNGPGKTPSPTRTIATGAALYHQGEALSTPNGVSRRFWQNCTFLQQYQQVFL